MDKEEDRLHAIETTLIRTEERVRALRKTTDKISDKLDQLLSNDTVKLQRIAKLETRQGIIGKVLGTVAGLLGAGIVTALITILV